MNQNCKLAGGSDLPPNPTSIYAHLSLSLRLHLGPLTNTDHSPLLWTRIILPCWGQPVPREGDGKNPHDLGGHNSIKTYFATSIRNSIPKLKQNKLSIFLLQCEIFNRLSVFPLRGYLK